MGLGASVEAALGNVLKKKKKRKKIIGPYPRSPESKIRGGTQPSVFTSPTPPPDTGTNLRTTGPLSL